MNTSYVRTNMPQSVQLGVADESIEAISPLPIERPQHLPLFYLPLERGRLEQQTVSAKAAERLFGKRSFNQHSEYFTHATRLAKAVMAAGGQQVMIKRLEPWVTAGQPELSDTVATLIIRAELISYVTESDLEALNPLQRTPGNAAYNPNSPWLVWARNDDELDPDTYGTYATGNTLVVPNPAGTGPDVTLTLPTTEAAAPVYGRKYVPAVNRQALMTYTGSGFTNLQMVRSCLLKWSVSTKKFTRDLAVATANPDTFEYSEYGYNVFEVAADSYGKWGNDVAIELFTQHTGTTTPYNEVIIDAMKALTFTGRVYERTAAGRTPTIVSTTDGSREVTFGLKPGMYHPDTGAQLPLSDMVDRYYDDGKLAGTIPVWPSVGRFNIAVSEAINQTLGFDSFLTALAEVELDGRSRNREGSWTHLTVDYPLTDPDFSQSTMYAMSTETLADDRWMLDPFTTTLLSGTAMFGVALHPDSVRFAEGQRYFLSGGNSAPSKGLSLTDASEIEPGATHDIYDIRVEEEITKHYDVTADGGRSLLDSLRYPFSCIYDSGFDLNVKLAIPLWLGYRPDVHVAIGTAIAGEGPIDVLDEVARGSMINTRAILSIPESEYFSTSPYRAVVLMQCGQLLADPNYTDYLPMTFELACARAMMFGAGNGRAKRELLYTEGGLNTIRFMKNVSNTYIRPTVRMQAWNAGLNYAQSRNERDNFYAAIKTVYNKNTSVMTSDLFMQITTDLKKVADRLWAEFTNTQTLTGEQLVSEWNARLLAVTNGIYADLVDIEPAAYISPLDDQLGYSWVGRMIVSGNNGKTVQRAEIVVRRKVTTANAE